jgi:hypothetical protein
MAKAPGAERRGPVGTLRLAGVERGKPSVTVPASLDLATEEEKSRLSASQPQVAAKTTAKSEPSALKPRRAREVAFMPEEKIAEAEAVLQFRGVKEKSGELAAVALSSSSPTLHLNAAEVRDWLDTYSASLGRRM